MRESEPIQADGREMIGLGRRTQAASRQPFGNRERNMRTSLMLAAALVLGGASLAVAAPIPAGQGTISGSSVNALVEPVRTVVKVKERRGMGRACTVRKKVVRMGGMKRVRKVKVCR
jgi:hypothetical protein